MVPPEWEHPKDEHGHYIPLFGGSVTERIRAWEESRIMWQRGFRRDYGDGTWVPKGDGYDYSFVEWDGDRPDPADHMPDWPPHLRTHFQMYEDTTEGTPISPAFATAEELARWLADNGAKAGAYSTATYEQWLATIRAGSAPSMTIIDGVLRSGVESAPLLAEAR